MQSWVQGCPPHRDTWRGHFVPFTEISEEAKGKALPLKLGSMSQVSQRLLLEHDGSPPVCPLSSSTVATLTASQ